jgi:hypothetical protein
MVLEKIRDQEEIRKQNIYRNCKNIVISIYFLDFILFWDENEILKFSTQTTCIYLLYSGFYIVHELPLFDPREDPG